MSRLNAASATDPGLVRRSNQDIALVADGLVAVADGMGGHAGGEVAASMAVNVLEASFAGQRSFEGLVAAAERANRTIFDHGASRQELRGMGTTLTAAALVSEAGRQRLAVVNVGDSRAYLARANELIQLTADHSLVEEMVRHGELSRAEAAVHPHRHILTRALGIDAGVEVDAWRFEPEVGSRLLLCSDGLTNECSDEEIQAILRAHADPAEAARELVERAVDHGGNDNVTVIVADVVAEDDAAPAVAGVAPGSARGAGARNDAERAGLAGAALGAGAVAAGAPGSAAATPPGARGRASRGERLAPVAEPGSPPQRAGGEAPRRTTAPASRPRPKPTPKPKAKAKAKAKPDKRQRRHEREQRRQRRDRVVTLWSVLFVVAFLAVLGGTAGFVEWFVRASYYVGFDKGRVAIYEGRPGGFLWFKPHLVDDTTLKKKKVFSPYVPLVEHGMIETSYAQARKVVDNLADANAFFALPGSSAPTTTTTTTTVPSATTLAPSSPPGPASSTTTSPTTTTLVAGTPSASTSSSTTTLVVSVPTVSSSLPAGG